MASSKLTVETPTGDVTISNWDGNKGDGSFRAALRRFYERGAAGLIGLIVGIGISYELWH